MANVLPSSGLLALPDEVLLKIFSCVSSNVVVDDDDRESPSLLALIHVRSTRVAATHEPGHRLR